MMQFCAVKSFFDEFMNKKECPTSPSDGDVHVWQRLLERPLFWPSYQYLLTVYKIPNLSVGIGDSIVESFTTKIDTLSILDLKHGIQLESKISMTINSRFAHFLTLKDDEDYTMNIIDNQEQEVF